MMKNAFYVILTLKDLFISESCIEIKIKLNFYFQEVWNLIFLLCPGFGR